jgi:hypothetical protein
MRLCMFHPLDHPMERGWVGRVDGEHVTQLAAQTLQAYFTGGGTAREHAVYPLEGVEFLAPVLHPPAVRIFENQTTFAFANPAAIRGPGAAVPGNGPVQGGLVLSPRVAGVIGAEEQVAGYTLLGEWRRPELPPPKDRDFALGLGPVVVTPDELDGVGVEVIVRVDGDALAGDQAGRFDWQAARDLAADGTELYPGDLLVGPATTEVSIVPGSAVEIEVDGIGALRQQVASTDAAYTQAFAR